MQMPTKTRLVPVFTVSWSIERSFIMLSVRALPIFPLDFRSETCTNLMKHELAGHTYQDSR